MTKPKLSNKKRPKPIPRKAPSRKAPSRKAPLQKRFYQIHTGRQLYEVIDLDAIIYIKMETGSTINHKAKVIHKITLSDGTQLAGSEWRKAEGGKPAWAERLVNAWQKRRKQEAEL